MSGPTRSSPPSAASGGTGAPLTPSRGGVGLNFPASVIWAANGKYMGFPSAARCADGSIFAVARRGNTHALDQGVIVGKRSYDGGRVWQPDSKEATLVSGTTIGDAVNDPRDPCLWTSGTRLYLSYYLNTFSGGVRNGTWLMWSDDNGKTWSTPTRMHASYSAPTRPKLFSDGKWRWPVYNLSPVEARLLVADAVEGPWTDSGAAVAAAKNEWDLIEAGPAVVTGAAVAAVGTGGAFSAGTYFWKVTALNATGESAPSAEVSVAIVASGSATLTWNALPGATGYRVYRGTASNVETVHYDVGNVTTFTDTAATSIAGGPPAPTMVSWIGFFRDGSAGQASVSQSTDLGASWSAQVTLDTVSSLKYDAWPALRYGNDGRLLCFARSGTGQRLVQCLDPANALTPANWREHGQRGANGKPLDVAPTGHSNWFVGKYQPWREGDLWMGAYMAEQNDAQTAAEARFGIFNEREILGNLSYVSTGEDTSAANGFTAGAFSALPTVDTVTVRAPANGANYVIEANWASKQQSATTIQTFQVGVFRDGVQIPTTEMDQFIVAASVVSVAGSEYRHGVRGEVFLTGGVHTIELRYAQQSSVTQPRTFSNRLLRVRPAA